MTEEDWGPGDPLYGKDQMCHRRIFQVIKDHYDLCQVCMGAPAGKPAARWHPEVGWIRDDDNPQRVVTG